MDLQCWCDSLICLCDDLPPMCLDLEQLKLIHNSFAAYYSELFHIGNGGLPPFGRVMSDSYAKVVLLDREQIRPATVRLSQFEPP